MQTIEQLEKTITKMYDAGLCSPLGADGGVMNYISCYVDGQKIRASITNDAEIKKVRAIWRLDVDGVEIYDLSKQYYKLRI